MTYSPELIAAAKAMYVEMFGVVRWNELDRRSKKSVCKAFAAGLKALLPESGT